MSKLTCFKSYDIRGRLGEELNQDIAYRIGRAFAQWLNARQIAIGSDNRPSSPTLKAALARGMLDAGADVIDLGLTGTEEVYFAAAHLDVDGAIEVTASHNPIEFNGMKLVGRGARPISCDSGLIKIQHLAELADFISPAQIGQLHQRNLLVDYVAHLLSYIELNTISPFKLVVNAGNGAAGHVIDEIERRLCDANVPIKFIKVHHEADSRFPHGIPNPLLPEKREATRLAVQQHSADMGIAWDGDFDRCFLFDEQGNFIEGYYIVGLLAEAFLARYPGENIVHDPRLTWNTIAQVKKGGGIPIQSKTGHAFIKEKMRAVNAIYGGEMSAHHYFRDFSYCDSGMIPWLLVIDLMSKKGQPLSQLVGNYIKAFPCSGEINYSVENATAILHTIKQTFIDQAIEVDYMDGLSMSFIDWRFNIRVSNTEPLLRLNVEARQNHAKVLEAVTMLTNLINQH